MDNIELKYISLQDDINVLISLKSSNDIEKYNDNLKAFIDNFELYPVPDIELSDQQIEEILRQL